MQVPFNPNGKDERSKGSSPGHQNDRNSIRSRPVIGGGKGITRESILHAIGEVLLITPTDHSQSSVTWSEEKREWEWSPFYCMTSILCAVLARSPALAPSLSPSSAPLTAIGISDSAIPMPVCVIHRPLLPALISEPKISIVSVTSHSLRHTQTILDSDSLPVVFVSSSSTDTIRPDSIFCLLFHLPFIPSPLSVCEG